MEAKRLFVVLGMHRSGTSVITRALQVMGVQLGDRLLPTMAEVNAKGFWEDFDLNALNVEMLAALDSDWFHLAPIEAKDVETLRNEGYFLRAVELLRQKVNGVAVFGFKDPRVAKLLPFWKEVFNHCKLSVSYVLAIRHPLSVVKSLAKRDGLAEEQSYLLWLGHVITALGGSTGDKRVLVDYDRLLQSPDCELTRIANRMDLKINPAKLQIYKTEFLDQGLRHTVFELNDLLLDKACPPIVREVYDALLDVASDEVTLDDQALQSKVSRWSDEFERIKSPLMLVDRLFTQKRIATQAVAERDGQIASLSQTVAEGHGQIAILNEALAARERRSSDRLASMVTTLVQETSQRAEAIADLTQAVAEREGQIASLNLAMAERDGQIASLNNAVAERDGQLAHLNQALGERDRQIASLDQKCAEAARSIDEIRASTSWSMTAPMRFASTKAKNIINLIKLLPRIYHFGGGAVGVARKAWQVFAREGWVGVKRRIVFVAQGRSVSFGPEPEENEQNDYSEWVRRYDTLTDADREKIRTRIDSFHRKPLFSVVMPVYNPPIVFFEKAIQSVRNQLYPDWELCIADDASTDPLVRKVIERHCKQDRRIKVVYRTENGHISKASNSALELAQGDYVAMFDHDDAIPEHALYLFAEELNRNPETDFLYSDQDKIDTNDVRYDPYFKPDFNPDLLRSQNFVDHLAVFRTSIVRELGGWRTEFDGSQDYDLVLRVTERILPSRIAHIPYVLYHWRAVPGSLAIDSGAKNYAPVTSRKALAEHLERLGIQAEVTSQYPNLSIHRVVYPLATEPMVSVIIPTKDGVDILNQCIDGLLNKTEYKNFEIIIVNNQSSEPETYTYLERICADPRIKVIDFDEPFNYSRINNIAAREAKGSILALLNNDIEIINGDWLREMVSHAVRPEIGAVGARLYYPDGSVQHAGVLLGYKGRAGHMYRYASPDWLGYWARGVLIQNLTAVTAACMVVRKELFEAVGGFDEENFTVTFNDVDLCLRIHEEGYRNLYTPYAELYHHESKTRGLLAFQSEEDYFALRWKKYIEHDPAYNPNLSLTSENFALAYPPRVSRPWIEQGESPDRSGAPLVTIITRTHGERHEFLRESLASVFRQTYRPIQIVIVEDGGNNMRAMIDTISPPKGITIDYESLPKRGRCYAGNRGLELAQGELFGFLDDDDLFLPDHVESLVHCLYSHPAAVGAYASSWEIPTEVKSLSPLEYTEGKKRLFGSSSWSLSQLWAYNYITIQSLLLRKELYIKYGGLSEELDCLEDWDLWLRYTAEEDFVFLNKPTSEFRMPKNEAVLLDRRKQHLQYLPILRKRQSELLERYKNTTSHERLRAAFVGK